MITRLSIKNFALIDNLEIELASGLNVITGETGAGKSIIIDAMGLIIGNTGLQDYIRTGEDKALVEGLFDISGYLFVNNQLAEMGVQSEDNNLLLTRELQRNGKNLCRINGRIVTLSMYRQIGELLVDIYGQNHQQSLLLKEKHLTLLDSFGGEQLKKQLEGLLEIVKEYRQVVNQLCELQRDEADKARQLDVFNYQIKEIDEADLKKNEEEQLTDEFRLLTNAERLSELSMKAYSFLYKGNSTQSPALDLLHNALAALKELMQIDPSMEGLASQLEEAIYQVEDCAQDLNRYGANINFDPARHDEVTARLDKIKLLKRKYGASIQEILKYRAEIASSVHKLCNAEEEILKFNEMKSSLEEEYHRRANKLTELRKKIANQIEQEICSQLRDLNMSEVKFKVDFKLRKDVSRYGFDDVEFLISPNPGEPLKPLIKIASGGEVSRIMLAMKAVLAKVDEMPTLIFDEIDAGLGGAAVQAVAKKLSFLGKSRQVICVTHSPQIASFAERHFNIAKVTEGSRTVTKIIQLEDDSRALELARMLGGNNITDITLQNAVEMLKIGQENARL